VKGQRHIAAPAGKRELGRERARGRVDLDGLHAPHLPDARIDREAIYELLDQMRATIPEEIKQARWIVKERQEMLAEAKRESDRIVEEARDRAERQASEQEVVKLAQKQSEEIMDEARLREREVRLGAEDYADEVLGTLEVNLEKFTSAVRRGRERLQGKSEDVDGGPFISDDSDSYRD
jgi:hypothetical protein